jgi:hypothetical protein
VRGWFVDGFKIFKTFKTNSYFRTQHRVVETEIEPSSRDKNTWFLVVVLRSKLFVFDEARTHVTHQKHHAPSHQRTDDTRFDWMHPSAFKLLRRRHDSYTVHGVSHACDIRIRGHNACLHREPYKT